MNPKALAEKICTLLNVNPTPQKWEKAMIANINAVESELKEALDEAAIVTSDEGTSYCRYCEQRAISIEEAKAAAYEEGVKASSEQVALFTQRVVEREVKKAYEEGYQKGVTDCESCHPNDIQKAKKEAYEQAAKIAENSFLDWELYLVDHAGDSNLIAERTFIAQAIRALKSEVK